MKKTVKKLYNGFIELRDYDVQKALQREESITVYVHNEGEFLGEVDLPPSVLCRPVKVSGKIKSKKGGKDYRLFAYNYEQDSQLVMFK